MYQIHSSRLKLYSVSGAVLLFAFMVGFANAQTRQRLSPEEQQERFEKQLEETVAALDLSDAQTPRFVEIMAATNADLVELRMEMLAGGDRTGLREKVMKLNEQTNLALSEVLSSEQMEKYKEIQAERRSRRGRP